MSMDKTLAEVRYAYRFILEFQQRLLDTVRLISEQFDDRVFYQWSNYKGTPVSRTGISPFNNAPEQFLPLYGASFMYVSADADKAQVKPGNWMLEITLIPDTAHLLSFEADMPFDPLAGEFGTPETAKSLIRLTAWKCNGELRDNANWLHTVWSSLEWPSLDVENELFTQLDGNIVSVAISKDMSQLSDRQEILDFSAEAKNFFTSKLGLI